MIQGFSPRQSHRHLLMPGNVGGLIKKKRKLEEEPGEDPAIRRACVPALVLIHLLQGSVYALIKRE